MTAPREDPAAIRAALADGTIRRILAVRAARVGDTLHVRPALDLLRSALPDAFVCFLCSEYAHPVARGAAAERVVPYPHKGRTPGAALARRRVEAELRALGPFDLWLGLEDKVWGRRLAERLGVRYWHSASAVGTHVVERKAGVLAGLGLWSGDLRAAPPPAITWTPDPAPDVTDPLAALPSPRIGFQAGSHASRGWLAPRRRRDPTPEWLARVGAAVAGAVGGSVVLHAGAGGVEARVARGAARLLERSRVPTRVLAGLSLDALGSALKTLDVLVTPNTGPAHMAAAVGTPVVLLEGPTPTTLARPWRLGDRLRPIKLDLPCSPCTGKAHGRACLVPRCLDEVSAERVLREVRAVL